MNMNKYTRKRARRSNGSWNNDYDMYILMFYKLMLEYKVDYLMK